MLHSLEPASIHVAGKAMPAPVHFEQVPVARRGYLPELDMLRFFAFLSVFLFHTINLRSVALLARWPLVAHVAEAAHQSLSFGLSLFFFLSAYLITSILRVEQTRTGSIAIRKFYLRRILRIWPLYIVFLLAAFLLGRVWDQSALSAGRLAAFLLLAGNWYSIRFGLATPVLAPLWSISVEEQFYAVWPWLACLLSPRRLALVCGTLCLVSLGAIFALAAVRTSVENIWFNSLAQVLFFAAGGLLALRTRPDPRPRSVLRAAALIAGGLGCWLAGSLCIHVDLHQPAAPLPMTACYVFAALGCTAVLSGFLALPPAFVSRPLVYLGRISYGLYVFHMLAVCALGSFVRPLLHQLHLRAALLPLSLLFTIALAAVSYQVLEKPFLRLKSRLEVVPTRPL